MTCSPARLAANRANSQKSCGPKTPEGKARSRGNALKHGLTGDGVALSIEDAAEVETRYGGFAAELRPRGAVGVFLVQRAALFSVRLDRCAREETRRLNKRINHAEAAFDADRLAEVDRLMADLATNPAIQVRRLREMPEGIDRMIEAFQDIQTDLHQPTRPIWDCRHHDLLIYLMGRNINDLPMARVAMLSQAVVGRFDWLKPDEGAGLTDSERGFWARRELSAIIDAEIKKLQDHRETLDLEAIDRDRSAAPELALLDTTPEANLARKYEATAERNFHRALADLAQVEKRAQGPAEEDSTGPGRLASFFPEAEPVDDDPDSLPFPAESGSSDAPEAVNPTVEDSHESDVEEFDQRTNV